MANALDANNPHGIFYIFFIFVEKEKGVSFYDKDIKD